MAKEGEKGTGEARECFEQTAQRKNGACRGQVNVRKFGKQTRVILSNLLHQVEHQIEKLSLSLSLSINIDVKQYIGIFLCLYCVFCLSFSFSYCVCIEDTVDGGDETPTGAWDIGLTMCHRCRRFLWNFCSYRKEGDGSKTMQHPLCISFGSQGASP